MLPREPSCTAAAADFRKGDVVLLRGPLARVDLVGALGTHVRGEPSKLISVAPLSREVYTPVTTILTNVVVTAGASTNRWWAALCCRDTVCVPASKVSNRQNINCLSQRTAMARTWGTRRWARQRMRGQAGRLERLWSTHFRR